MKGKDTLNPVGKNVGPVKHRNISLDDAQKLNISYTTKWDI